MRRPSSRRVPTAVVEVVEVAGIRVVTPQVVLDVASRTPGQGATAVPPGLSMRTSVERRGQLDEACTRLGGVAEAAVQAPR